MITINIRLERPLPDAPKRKRYEHKNVTNIQFDTTWDDLQVNDVHKWVNENWPGWTLNGFALVPSGPDKAKG
jgi:hypothetical protein